MTRETALPLSADEEAMVRVELERGTFYAMTPTTTVRRLLATLDAVRAKEPVDVEQKKVRGVMGEADGLRTALWQCGVESGMDTDGDDGPGALIAGMGDVGFAAAMVEEVRLLRRAYDECLSGPDVEAFRPLLAWAESCSQHYAMLRQEPPFTSTQRLKDALATAYAALAPSPTPGEPTDG